MSSINLIESFQEFKEAENIDRPTMMKVIEDVFKTLLRKKHGSDENFDVIVNDKTGDLEIFRRREIGILLFVTIFRKKMADKVRINVNKKTT